MNLAPVDWVSQAIVTTCQSPASMNEVFHLVNGDTITWAKLSNLLWSCNTLEPLSENLKRQLGKLEVPVNHKIWWDYLQQEIVEARKSNQVGQ